MPNVEPHRLAATTLVRRIENGELSAEAVVASCLARITAREPVVRAWSHLAGEAALVRAREIDRSGKKTLLNGVPFGLKDIFDTADFPLRATLIAHSKAGSWDGAIVTEACDVLAYRFRV